MFWTRIVNPMSGNIWEMSSDVNSLNWKSCLFHHTSMNRMKHRSGVDIIVNSFNILRWKEKWYPYLLNNFFNKLKIWLDVERRINCWTFMKNWQENKILQPLASDREISLQSIYNILNSCSVDKTEICKLKMFHIYIYKHIYICIYMEHSQFADFFFVNTARIQNVIYTLEGDFSVAH